MDKSIAMLSGIPEITRGRIDRHIVFRDFFEILAIRISNGFDPVHYKARLEHTKELWEKYTIAEQEQFEKYFNMLANILARNMKIGYLPDTLGRLYEQYGHLSAEQELTPKEIAEICHRIAVNPEEQIAKRGFVEFYEPTCGSGGLMFQSAEIMLEKGYNIIDKLVIFANDVNPRSVHMAYIQASLYCIPAVITQADVFTLREADRWYTPAYILGNWVWRRPFNHTTARSRDDEMLKMMTDPMYATIRRFEWMEKGAKTNDGCNQTH